jgi:osmotically-inducible protein OsmY
VALAVPLTLMSIACASSSMRTGGSSSTSMSANEDQTITARVKTVLLNDTQIGATRIDVATASGVVTISGTVKSKADEQRAIQLARQVPGVKDVRSTLTIPQL